MHTHGSGGGESAQFCYVADLPTLDTPVSGTLMSHVHSPIGTYLFECVLNRFDTFLASEWNLMTAPLLAQESPL